MWLAGHMPGPAFSRGTGLGGEAAGLLVIVRTVNRPRLPSSGGAEIVPVAGRRPGCSGALDSYEGERQVQAECTREDPGAIGHTVPKPTLKAETRVRTPLGPPASVRGRTGAAHMPVEEF